MQLLHSWTEVCMDTDALTLKHFLMNICLTLAVLKSANLLESISSKPDSAMIV